MKHRTKKIISYIVSLLVIIIAAVWVGGKFVHLGKVEFTDNAQIRQQVVPVNSRVQGYIKEIRFKEYEPVKKGDTIV
ncbi:MAG: HlyD family secretion protein, partial [Duncaniella sp.]|nr:HlyD family secretion protein [Duncaniella sp.]